MDRRGFLSAPLAETIPENTQQYDRSKYDKLFQSTDFNVESGLEKYSGEWTKVQRAHLLRRTLFGFNKEQFDSISTKSLDEIIDDLFASESVPPPPINVNPDDPVEVGQAWIDEHSFGDDPQIDNSRVHSVRSWWSLLMLKQGVSIREKMTLFWHNHFATESVVYRVPHFAYWQNQLLRKYSTGNFKELVEKITLDPAMLLFLNGNQNTNRAPNENYGRELLELFTIGKGPQIEEGNYTNYTESDIQEASKILTGWSMKLRDGNIVDVIFNPIHHTAAAKYFSSAFDSKVIYPNEDNEYKDLISMIFEQEETSKYICRKLYRWFVNDKIDANVETKMIEPMAQMLRENNFETKPVIEALLKSQHFYDKNIIGCLIKNPMDFIYGMYKQFGLEIIDKSEDSLPDTIRAYDVIKNLGVGLGDILQMTLLDPPGVAGWPSYYQEPAFNRLWLNSVTMYYRFLVGILFVYKELKTRSQDEEVIVSLDLLKHTTQYSDPSNPGLLVSEVADYIFPIKLTEKQLSYLKDAIVYPGEEDYVWSGMWAAYVDNPGNEDIKKALEARLANLFVITLSLAENQIS